MQDTDEDIFLLQDSCEIKDQKLFEICEAHQGGIALNPSFQMYLGKYDRRILAGLEIPTPQSKAQAVHFELAFNNEYIKRDPNFTVFHQPLHDNHVYEDKFGCRNMILENDYIKKYKRCWNTAMITESTLAERST